MKIHQAIAELKDLFYGFDHEDPAVQDGIIAVAMGIKALKAIEQIKGHISGIENTGPEEDSGQPLYLQIDCGFANKEKNWCNYRNAPITNCWSCCYNKDVWESGKFRLLACPEGE